MNISLVTFLSLILVSTVTAQHENSYKKRVLETTEIDILSGYYSQTGDNASVTGGVGSEELTDWSPKVIISTTLGDDNVLTVDLGFSTYTSASSSNLDPFDSSKDGNIKGSPWVSSSGASKQDLWVSAAVNYAHHSEDRNHIWQVNGSFAKEYDYRSFGFGGGYTRFLNSRNTELSLKANVYLDQWDPVYPSELEDYLETSGDLNSGFFEGVPIWNQQSTRVDKSYPSWTPDAFAFLSDESRNSYSMSFSVSQILSRRAQMSLFFDVVMQDGVLANPIQRVYFKDKENYYIGNPDSIANYATPDNKDVFMLADDIERLPDSRVKIPVGLRFNYYFNERFSLRTYYRYYSDDWGITSHTASIEVPVKITDKITIYPSYRFYQQSEADYFAPFNEHLSTNDFYTSDYDLSKYNANQYGLGISYTDVFAKWRFRNFALKSIDMKINRYERDSGLEANFFSIGFKFILD